MSQGSNGSWRARHKPYMYAIVVAIILTFLVAPEIMDDKSMEPTIEKGSFMVITKHSYSAKRGAPKKGQVVELEKTYAPDVSKDNIISRVVGRPGNTVEIKSGKLYVNKKEYKVKNSSGNLGKDMKVKLDEDSVFLVSDNRDSKVDSRNKKLGPVSMKEIKGNAKLVVWPFKDFGIIK